MQYVTPGLTKMLRHAVNPFLLMHTYTRTTLLETADNPVTVGVDESLNAWGEPIETPDSGHTVPSLPCLYQEDAKVVIQPNGPITVNIPALLVPNDDVLNIGDLVSNVATKPDTRTGVPIVVLLQGPVRVEELGLIAPEFGGPLYKQAFLRSIEEVLQ